MLHENIEFRVVDSVALAQLPGALRDPLFKVRFILGHLLLRKAIPQVLGLIHE